MRKRFAGVVIAALIATASIFSQSASAATTVGNDCVGNGVAIEATLVQVANDASDGLPAAIPSAGVITSWTIDLPPTLPSGAFEEQLKVFERTSIPGQLKVVGESSLEPMLAGTQTFATRIPVKSGELIGSTGIETFEGRDEPAAFYCEGQPAGDLLAGIRGDPPTGATAEIEEEVPEFAQPITVAVEPDADGDGYGDETQDKCPTDASTQGPCPTTTAPPALSIAAIAGAKKNLVTVTTTSNVQASVTVAGSANLGKGKKAALSGGTQTVGPGKLVQFTVRFPAKLQAKLKRLSPKRHLTLSLSATAPGTTAATLTVKVKGEMKTRRRAHHKP